VSEVTRELGAANDLTMDEFLRTTIQAMFDNDNDTATLTTVLEANDGTESTILFTVRITSINGQPTREDED
jgi:hypothetical protein